LLPHVPGSGRPAPSAQHKRLQCAMGWRCNFTCTPRVHMVDVRPPPVRVRLSQPSPADLLLSSVQSFNPMPWTPLLSNGPAEPLGPPPGGWLGRAEGGGAQGTGTAPPTTEPVVPPCPRPPLRFRLTPPDRTTFALAHGHAPLAPEDLVRGSGGWQARLHFPPPLAGPLEAMTGQYPTGSAGLGHGGLPADAPPPSQDQRASLYAYESGGGGAGRVGGVPWGTAGLAVGAPYPDHQLPGSVEEEVRFLRLPCPRQGGGCVRRHSMLACGCTHPPARCHGGGLPCTWLPCRTCPRPWTSRRMSGWVHPH
jgi:hypothetical protein